MVGRGGSGVRPGMLRGGKDEKDGTEGKERAREEKRERKEMCYFFFEPFSSGNVFVMSPRAQYAPSGY